MWTSTFGPEVAPHVTTRPPFASTLSDAGERGLAHVVDHDVHARPARQLAHADA